MTTCLTSQPSAGLETVLAHIDHAVQLIGPWQVGFGSDGALARLDAAAIRRPMWKRLLGETSCGCSKKFPAERPFKDRFALLLRMWHGSIKGESH
jgi:hypothetical protein